jgi:AAA domain/Bifunctional DNA primase/polymerase, N-terminal
MEQPTDIYDRHAVKLMQMGYHPVPVAPLGFETDKCPVRWDPHTKQFFKFKNWNTLPPVTDPQPGANIGALMGGAVVALDYDHDDAALIICEAFPDSPVNKVGERGWTAFYRVEAAIPCEDFYNEDGELVLQILGTGKQTVLPPSIHPKTKRPYRWTNGHSLYDTSVEQLPLLPADYRERILKLGFHATRPSKPKPDKRLNNSDQGEPDGPYAELNQVAIRNLAKWVPQLNIYKLRRQRGQTPSYEGVAQWRRSTTGRPLEERALNLKISGMGIRDFGDGRGYSPLDLVIAARATSLSEAFCWLEEKLLPPKEGIEIDLDKIMEAQDAPKTAPEDDLGADDDQPKEKSSKERIEELLKSIGPVWKYGDPMPASAPMLVPNFVPDLAVFGYLYGATGALKTFLTDDLAVAIATCGKFAGQQVTEQRFVAVVELEKSSSQLRIYGAAKVRDVPAGEVLPIEHSSSCPHPILAKGELNSKWLKWARDFAEYVRLAAAGWGLRPGLIIVDTQNKVAGFRDEDSSAENSVVCKAWTLFAEMAGCAVLVVDHLGKDASRDQRGSSVKQTDAFYRLNAGEKPKDVYATRHLIITKMREGRDGLAINFKAADVEVEYSQKTLDGKIETVKAKTLAIEWGSDLVPVDAVSSDPGERDLTELEEASLAKLIDMINDEGVELPTECRAPAGLRGVNVDRWFVRLSRSRTFERGQSDREFKKLMLRLRSKRRIEVLDDWVWIPLVAV